MNQVQLKNQKRCNDVATSRILKQFKIYYVNDNLKWTSSIYPIKFHCIVIKHHCLENENPETWGPGARRPLVVCMSNVLLGGVAPDAKDLLIDY